MSAIQTFTGRMFDVQDPAPEDIDIRDIARALSYTPRFGGHLRCFYSVAQHSVEVSRRCDPFDALAGLLHDAGEAYMTDLAKPVKDLPDLEGFRTTEDRLIRAILLHFGVLNPFPGPLLPDSVKAADLVELVTEAYHLFRHPPEWLHTYPASPRGAITEPLSPARAERLFLLRFKELTQ